MAPIFEPSFSETAKVKDPWADPLTGIKTMGFVFTPPELSISALEAFGNRNSPGAEALHYQQMFGGEYDAAGVQRDVRLFGRPILNLENPSDPWANPVPDREVPDGAVSVEVALVRTDPSQSLPAIREPESLGNLRLIRDSLIMLVTSFPMGIVTIVNAAFSILSWATSPRRRQALRENLLALSDTSGVEGIPGIYRGSGNLSIPTLIQKILKPIEDYFDRTEGLDERLNNIRRLGAILRNSDLPRTEFLTGLRALLQIWIDPPVVRIEKRVLGAFEKFVNDHFAGLIEKSSPETKLRDWLRGAALNALVSALSKENLNLSDPAFRRNPQLVLMVMEALKVLISEVAKLPKDSDPVQARRLLQAFSTLLGDNHPVAIFHPEILKARKLLEQFPKALSPGITDEENDSTDEEP